ncbi:hypothetical protein [Jeotgalibacillus aurantiacus]|uniref:hypothetical protein n=1 Tax=Jeotgalibacillus aurantiacus TaxID=2763266 RepID=UPI001D0B98E2|nr:hypothetical protein [Jeotgalibacillus aurantiacus]
MNNIKEEIEKIKIPDHLHERSKMGVRKARSEKRKLKFRNPWVAAMTLSILGLGFIFSPSGQATFQGLFQVSTFEERANVKEMSFGYEVSNVSIYDEAVFTSLSEVEKAFDVSVPFPEKFIEVEAISNTELFKYNAFVDQANHFSGLSYNLSTQDRNYDLFVTNNPESQVNFSAETADGTAIDRDVDINGIKGKILGTSEPDSFALYIEKDSWTLVVMSTGRGESAENEPDIIEAEMIQIAESIKW